MTFKTTSYRPVARAFFLSLLVLSSSAAMHSQESEVSELLALSQTIAAEQKLEVDTSRTDDGMIAIVIGYATLSRGKRTPVLLGYEFKLSEASVRYVRLIVVNQGIVHHIFTDLGENPKNLKAMVGGPEAIRLHKVLVKRSKKKKIRLEEASRQMSNQLKSYLASL